MKVECHSSIVYELFPFESMSQTVPSTIVEYLVVLAKLLFHVTVLSSLQIIQVSIKDSVTHFQNDSTSPLRFTLPDLSLLC